VRNWPLPLELSVRPLLRLSIFTRICVYVLIATLRPNLYPSSLEGRSSHGMPVAFTILKMACAHAVITGEEGKDLFS
jgi:hypothetical protein